MVGAAGSESKVRHSNDHRAAEHKRYLYEELTSSYL